MITTTENKTVSKIFATIDRFATIEEKQIWGYIIKKIFHAIFFA